MSSPKGLGSSVMSVGEPPYAVLGAGGGRPPQKAGSVSLGMPSSGITGGSSGNSSATAAPIG